MILTACAGRVEAPGEPCGISDSGASAPTAPIGTCTFATESGVARGTADARRFVTRDGGTQLEIRCWAEVDYLVLLPATGAIGPQGGTLRFARGALVKDTPCAITIFTSPGLGGEKATGSFSCAAITLDQATFAPSGQFDALFGP